MNKQCGFLYTLLFCLCNPALAYFTQQSAIYTENGEEIAINGVSWSGFQDTNVFQGLQSNPFYSLPPSHPTGMMDTLANSLFKTIRLPLQPGVLYDNTHTVDLNKALTNKNNPTAGNGLFCQTWNANGSGCAKSVSPQQAFWTVLSETQNKGLRVMIDIHHRYGYGDNYRDGTVYEMDKYKADITYLAEQIKQRQFTHVIGIDIFNEPYRLNWFQSNDGQVPWTKVIAVAANAVYESNPELLLFVEGPDNGNDSKDNPIICVPKQAITDDPNGYSHSPDTSSCGTQERVFFKGNWGEDFKPLLNTAKAKQNQPEFDIERFKKELLKQGITTEALQWLLGDANANHAHIVFSPHVYPAEVAGWQTAPGKPSQLRFDWTWGFLSRAHYPVVLGEASWKTAQGKAFFTEALMPYLAKNMKTHQVFFWAIGYLGDTVTAIDPNTGRINQDVLNTLSVFFH